MSRSELLTLIAENPDETSHRKVYADWLSERGDPLGDFIRVQCDMHAMAEDDPRHADFARMQNEMIDQHEQSWLGPLREIADVEVGYDRGFVNMIRLRVSDFVASGDALLDELPLLPRVWLREVNASIEPLVSCQTLRRVTNLSLQENQLGNGAFVAIFASTQLVNIRELDLSKNQIGREGIEALGNCELPSVRHLDLSYNPLNEEQLAALAAAPSLRQLETLRVIRLSRSIDDFFPILQSPLASVVTQDSLEWAIGGEQSARLMVKFMTASSKDRLRISLDESGAAEFAKAPELQSVRSLDLSSSMLDGASFRRILKSEHLNSLEELCVPFVSIGSSGVRALASWAGLARLRKLELIDTQATAKAAVALMKSKHVSNLRWLDLCQNKIGSDWATALSENERFHNLEELHAEQCKLEDHGIRALVNSQNVRKLTCLSLTHNFLTDDSARAIAASPNLENLTTLVLSGNDISDEGALALASSDRLPNLVTLGLDGCVISQDVRRKLTSCIQNVSFTFDDQSDGQVFDEASMDKIIHEPDIVEHRLEYARSIEERDPDRSELITLQCGGQHIDREQELLAANLKRWRSELPNLPKIEWDWLGNWDWVETTLDQGFFQRIRVRQLRVLKQNRDQLYRATPIRELDLSGSRYRQSANAFADSVIQIGFPRGLRTFKIDSNDLRGKPLVKILESPSLRGLTELSVASNPLADRDIETLANLSFDKLERLNLYQTELRDVGLAALAGTRNMPSLRHLVLDHNYEMTGQGIGQLFHSEHRHALESLSLRSTTLKNDAFIQLAECPPLPNFHSLDLERTRPNADGLIALVNSPLFSTVRSLTVPDFESCDGAVASLAQSPQSQSLEHLNICNLDIGYQDFEALAESTQLRSLRRLELGQLYAVGPAAVYPFRDAPVTKQLEAFFVHICPMDTSDLCALLDSFDADHLRSLKLWRCEIDDEGAHAIANCPQLAELEQLDLFENRITAVGAAHLASSPYLSNLRELNLSSNQISSAGATALAESNTLGHLRYLNLQGCDVGPPGGRSIANAKNWKKLNRLNLAGNRIDGPSAVRIAESESLPRVILLMLNQNPIDEESKNSLKASFRISTV